MGGVAIVAVAGGEAPAIRPVPLEPVRVAHGVLIVDEGVRCHLLPVIGIAVLEAARAQAEEREMREKQRTAIGRAQLHLVAVILSFIPEGAACRPALVISVGVDRMGRRRGGKNIADQAFVPTMDAMAVPPAN